MFSSDSSKMATNFKRGVLAKADVDMVVPLSCLVLRKAKLAPTPGEDYFDFGFEALGTHICLLLMPPMIAGRAKSAGKRRGGIVRNLNGR